MSFDLRGHLIVCLRSVGRVSGRCEAMIV